MIKRLFDWTPRDIAYWEKIRQQGWAKFIAWYGLVITGGVLFAVFGLVTLILWITRIWGEPVTSSDLIFLFGQLIFTGLVCLIGGAINGLVTWVVEERMYKKYKARQDRAVQNPDA